MVCSSCQKGSLVTHSPYILPKNMFLNLPRDAIRSTDFVSTPYDVLRQRHEIKVIPPPVTCVMLMISKMSSMSFFTAPIPTWFLSAGNTYGMHLCFSQQELTMCSLSWARTITSFIFSSYELMAFYDQASSHTSWLKAFLCKPCKPYYQLSSGAGFRSNFPDSHWSFGTVVRTPDTVLTKLST